MKIQEFYKVVGGNYDEAMGRLMTEQRICKYLRKMSQTDDVSQMNAAFDEQRWEEAFRFSHNVKGVSLNLSLNSLAESASALCETVRNGIPAEDYFRLLDEVNAKYRLFLDALEQLED